MLNNQLSNKALVYLFVTSLFAILLLINEIVLIRCAIKYNCKENPISIFINIQNAIWTCYLLSIILFLFGNQHVSICSFIPVFIPVMIILSSLVLHLVPLLSQCFRLQQLNHPNLDFKEIIWMYVKSYFLGCCSLIRHALLHFMFHDELLLK